VTNVWEGDKLGPIKQLVCYTEEEGITKGWVLGGGGGRNHCQEKKLEKEKGSLLV